MAELSAAPHRDGFPSSSKASCSASTSYVHYDVFINHCGGDADAGTFATDLYSRLISRDLHVFLDKLVYEEEEFASQMEAAISLASVRIVIFSRNYAKWKWCLDALVHMTKSEGTILPVFYKVKPSEVRWTGKGKGGPYAQWMLEHEKKERYDLQAIHNWRDVMSHVSEISGFELEACNGGEEELLEKVVESVFKVCPHPHYDVFISHRGPDTKSKFARPLYERVKSCGLRVFFDQPELVEGLEITRQIELAIGVARFHIAIFSPTYARSNWCLDELNLMTMSGATVLPVFYEVEPSVLDGVYAEVLADHEKSGRYNSETIQKWRGALSKVAKINDFVLDGNKGDLLDEIVQRVMEHFPHSQVVQSSEVQSVVKCVLMENDDPKSCNAIRSSQVVQRELKHYFGLEEKLEDLEKTVLSEREEEHAVAKVVGILGGAGVGKTTLAKEFLKCRKSNYNAYFFLDIKEHARRPALTDLQSKIIEGLTHTSDFGIETPKDLRSCHALVILDDVDQVDQLDALLLMKNSIHPESMFLVTSRDGDVLERSGIVDSSIYHLTGLNTLHAQELFCSYAFKYWPPGWEFAVLVDKFVGACRGLPPWLNLFGKLLCGKDRSFWKAQLHALSDCEVPVQLFLGNLSGIEELPNLEHLTSLETLHIQACRSLRSIHGLVQLTKLRTLSLVGLNEIEELPGLKDLTCLETLEIRYCRKLRSIENLGQLTKLRKLTLEEILWIGALPGLEHLTSLEKLDVRRCRSLRSINGLGQLTKLRTLSLVGLNEIEELPSLKDLTCLKTLEIRYCRKLRSIEILGQLTKLRKLTLEEIPEIGALPGLEHLTSLEKLDVMRCRSLRSIHGLGQLTKLRTLSLVKLVEIEELSGLKDLTCLETLMIWECEKLRSIENLGQHTKLDALCLIELPEIEELPSLEHLTSLETLEVRACKKLQSLQGLAQLTKLRILYVYDCSGIEELPGIEYVMSLEDLVVKGCPEVHWGRGVLKQLYQRLEHLHEPSGWSASVSSND